MGSLPPVAVFCPHTAEDILKPDVAVGTMVELARALNRWAVAPPSATFGRHFRPKPGVATAQTGVFRSRSFFSVEVRDSFFSEELTRALGERNAYLYG
jgi:hypothetical protein